MKKFTKKSNYFMAQVASGIASCFWMQEPIGYMLFGAMLYFTYKLFRLSGR